MCPYLCATLHLAVYVPICYTIDTPKRCAARHPTTDTRTAQTTTGGQVDYTTPPKKRKAELKMKKIYGVSSKYNFGYWEHYVVVFCNQEDAERWLNTEEYDFRERELMSKTAAIKLAGKRAVLNAEE